MTLRAVLRENQRQSNQNPMMCPARNAERDRYSHLHLIQRDGREGLFLPVCPAAATSRSRSTGKETPHEWRDRQED